MEQRIPPAKRPEFTVVKTEKSNPVPVTERDSWSLHFTGEKNCCPTSTHRQKRHRARASHRITVTDTYATGRKSKSYEDICKCEFCGFEWTQEWMPGLI